jgi:hypothetical protein
LLSSAVSNVNYFLPIHTYQLSKIRCALARFHIDFAPTRNKAWIKERLGADLPAGKSTVEAYPGYATPIVLLDNFFELNHVSCRQHTGYNHAELESDAKQTYRYSYKQFAAIKPAQAPGQNSIGTGGQNSIGANTFWVRRSN